MRKMQERERGTLKENPEDPFQRNERCKSKRKVETVKRGKGNQYPEGKTRHQLKWSGADIG